MRAIQRVINLTKTFRYAEHHIHSHFSQLDGVGTADEYFARAKEIGVEHLTLTDHATLTGHADWLRAGKEHGIGVGLGVEGYFSVTDRFDKRTKKSREDGTEIYNHIGIIAKNENGLKNLQALNKVGWMEGYYHKPRIDFEALEEYKDDLIILSGCMSGVVSKAVLKGDMEGAEQWAEKFKALMGDDFYMEIMSHNPDELTKAHFDIADKFGIKPIITSDCHHVSKDDLVLQEAMLILSTNPKIAKDFDFTKSQKMDWLDRFNYVYPDRNMTFEKFDLHLHDAAEHFNKMNALGYGRSDYLESTIEIAEKIGDYPQHRGLDLLPKPKVDDLDAFLRNKVLKGLKEFGLDTNQEYLDRVERELKVIKDKEFATYFIILEDVVRWARGQGILIGPGRGSSAGSLVCYALKITTIDPIKYDLLFERFLDMSRDDWPDIDTDFQDDRRGEVKAYVKKKFKHTGNIMTFTYLNGKNILKDAGTVLRIPFAVINEVSKEIIDWEDYLTNPKTAEFRRKHPEVAELGEMMRGRLRSVGMHAAGVVLANQPIENYIAVESAKNPDDASSDRVEVLATDGDGAAEIGLIKYDFLGLTALTNIQRTVDLVNKHHGVEIDLDSISLDDKSVYASINKASTLGLFQLEGNAFTQILDQMPIETFEDVVNATALIRPGAADSSFGKRFIKARQTGKWKPYCEEMRSFTKDTYGEILMQEQLMLTVQHVAGMSAVEANKIRKIIGKKKDVTELDVYRDKFVAGAADKLGGEAKAIKMWEDFEKSANYQFNKSHAVAYSVITYWTMWLKHYYPTEFMLSLLLTEKDAFRRLTYLNECKRLGIRIRMPHVNLSDIKISRAEDSKGPYLRLGLSDVKYVGAAAANKIIKARPFDSAEQFKDAASQKYSGINARAVDCLDKVGALRFDDNPLTGNEKDSYYELLSIPSFSMENLPDSAKEVLTTLSAVPEEGPALVLALVADIVRKGWQRADLFDETGTRGVFFDSNIEISKGEYLLFLLVNGNLVKVMRPEDFGDKSGLDRYLSTKTLKPFDGYRVVDFTYMTVHGKQRGYLTVTDKNRMLHGAVVYGGPLFYKVISNAKPGTILREFRTKRNVYKGRASTVLEDIE